MIATLRAKYDIPVALDDADRLKDAGYTPDEIAIALSTPEREH